MINTMKKCRAIALLCALLILVTPTLSMAQETSEAIVQAQADAQRDANGTLWFILSCLFGVIPLIIAYAISPSPPMSRLIGKSPEYVAVYSDEYTSRVKSSRTSNALWGCLLGTAIEVGCYFLLFAAAAAAE